MHSPVVIYQMGKVGSTTIKHTLDAYSIANYQIHYLGSEALSNIERKHQEKGLKVPQHIARSREVHKKKVLFEDEVKVVSLIRDPVSRNVSAFFQNINSYFNSDELKNVSVKTLIDTFLSKYPHEISISWFDKELKTNIGIDICDFEFDKGSPYFVIKNAGGNITLILIKVEASDEDKKKALSELLVLPDNFKLVKGNIGEEKSYSEIYQQFKAQIKLPNDYLEKMYGSKVIRNIYDDESIHQMKSKWVR